ncbi:hypothetical protein GmHk_09G025013 [Glycine max]|nr:hypothetical protein GmHk_09G025013 [Glycine max]
MFHGETINSVELIKIVLYIVSNLELMKSFFRRVEGMVDLAAPISFPCTACPRNKKHGIGICCYNLGNIKECKQVFIKYIVL